MLKQAVVVTFLPSLELERRDSETRLVRGGPLQLIQSLYVTPITAKSTISAQVLDTLHSITR